ncbi:MAG TPA: spermidine/putrescine ABC transporter substrate-binding protein [Egibacteraceae bacterium]|nr:spermidine/putrescine ABC transporter substrate-binding protein [Egibacteraceae bacterium]
MRTRWITLLALLTLMAAACNSGSPIEGPAGDTPAEGDAAACEEGETDGDLLLYNWSEYIDPELVEAFESEHGVTLTEDFYPSNEEMLARVQSGASGYDVVVPSDYMVSIMIEEELLLPLDRDAIPNWENISDQFLAPPYDPDLEFSMPYQWGTTGLGVNLDAVGEDYEPSWGLVFDADLADEHAGRISMLDDPRETLGAALVYLGYSINSTSEDELAEAAELVAEATGRLAAYSSDQYSDLLMAGETVIAHGYSGGFFAAYDEAENPDQWDYFVPAEGGTIWTDNMAILGDAPHPCTAHTFINFILDAENGAALTNWTYYASPNAAAEENIISEILEDPAIYPDDELMANLQFIEDTGDFEIQYQDHFSRAKG